MDTEVVVPRTSHISSSDAILIRHARASHTARFWAVVSGVRDLSGTDQIGEFV